MGEHYQTAVKSGLDSGCASLAGRPRQARPWRGQRHPVAAPTQQSRVGCGDRPKQTAAAASTLTRQENEGSSPIRAERNPRGATQLGEGRVPAAALMTPPRSTRRAATQLTAT